MPELPEVETVRRGLEPAMVGRRILEVEQRRPDLRFPLPDNFAGRLRGRRVEALSRRAKYLLADLDDGTVLIMHLGMSGSFRIDAASCSEGSGGSMPGVFHHPRSTASVHDHVVFALEGGATVTYNDPRRFGFMLVSTRRELPDHPFFRDLGIEPLGNALDGAALATRFAGKTAPLKAALLDQTLIAGLGNIYVCEALHRARLSPRRLAGSIVLKGERPSARAVRLATAIREVLEAALAAGGSSLRDHRLTDGTLGMFQHVFRVYDREDAACPTPGCRGVIKRIVQSGRSTFFCGVCQI